MFQDCFLRNVDLLTVNLKAIKFTQHQYCNFLILLFKNVFLLCPIGYLLVIFFYVTAKTTTTHSKYFFHLSSLVWTLLKVSKFFRSLLEHPVTQITLIDLDSSRYRMAEERRRRTNSVAAKRSQQKSRIRRLTVEQEKIQLELKNRRLCRQVASLEQKIVTLREIYLKAVTSGEWKCSKRQ